MDTANHDFVVSSYAEPRFEFLVDEFLATKFKFRVVTLNLFNQEEKYNNLNWIPDPKLVGILYLIKMPKLSFLS